MEILTNIATVLSLIGVGTLIGVFVKHFLEMKKETRLQNQKFKEDRYNGVINYMRSYLNPEGVLRGFYTFSDKSIQHLSGEELTTRLMNNIKEIYFEIVLYGDYNVITSIKSFIKEPSKKNWLATIISMRQDLWNEAKLKIEDIDI